MSDLLMRRSAILSGEADCYREELWRVWDDTRPILVVCMLNPSTADAQIDDPTILTLIHFARLWGYGAILVVNLYAWRSSSPAAMMTAVDPTGPGNITTLNRAMELAAAQQHVDGRSRLLVAWGNHGAWEDSGREEWFANRATNAHGLELICLGRTRSGAPKHPMARGKHRIPRDQQPVIWRRPADDEQV